MYERYRSAIARLRRTLDRRVPGNRGGAATPRRAYGRRDLWVTTKIGDAYDLISLPLLTVFIFHDRQFDRSYGLTWRRKWSLALRMYRNTRRVATGTSNRAHMAMAAKIFAIPATVAGVIVEAGCWKGGTTANLSLIADVVGRELVVYDSFEGLPAPSDGDRWASPLGEGAFRGELEEVRSNVARYGVVERCRFRKGWFSETLPSHTEPIVAAFVDVDHQASMHECVLGLWPHLIDSGYWFIDEYTRLDYCALFFSERFWRTYFDRPPPGLMGAGTGIAVGQYFTGPLRGSPPIQQAGSIAWTRKDFYGEWDYFPDDVPAVPLRGGPGAAYGVDGWVMTTPTTAEVGDRKLSELLATDAGQRKLSEALATDAGQRKLSEWLATDAGQRKLAERLAATRAVDGPTNASE
jgi:O-methyltransferase